MMIISSGSGLAENLAFSDPARIIPPPDYAIGFPSRDANLDVLPGFKKPPAGYGEVAFYWWQGDPLTRERLAWQIKQLSGRGVMGLTIIYAHSDRGGSSWGLTYPSDPPLFSEKWWELTRWFAAEAKKHGMAVSLSDYTLCWPGQGWYMDEIRKEDPALVGSVLKHMAFDVPGGKAWSVEVPEGVLSAVAYRVRDGALVPGSALDLRGGLRGRVLTWQVPEGTWKAVVVYAFTVSSSVDPMNPRLGRMLIEKFYQRMEDHLPAKTLNFFFSDELGFGLRGHLWNERFAREFRARKGYDVLPELAALFLDIGPRTPKVRLDYNDVMVALEEESYFRPLFDWHQARGMIAGCDHGGRGGDVTEFGDYFRTQRWNQGPGCDQPHLEAVLIKNKIASSMAHLYLRPRTWLEGYYGSGWGTTPAQLTGATMRNFMMGQNLLSLHGLYYSLHGGWWEWAPPCNHFRMPYWAHMDKFMDCVQRLSYLLSQGYHRCDVAIIYPVAPKEAGLDGEVALNTTAFAACQHLYESGIDSDFMDFESLARAEIRNKKLCVSGEEYRVLILAAMKAVRYSTIQKAAEFYRAGGMVIALGALPEASDRAGREDPELDRLVKEIFGVSAKEAAGLKEARIARHASGGLAVLAQQPQQAEKFISESFTRDFAVRDAKVHPCFMHRKVGPRDIFAVYGVPENTECFFRASGKVELWDPWTGDTRPLAVASQTAEGTTVKMPLTETEAQLVIFSPGTPELGGTDEKSPVVMNIDGPWEFELKPTMDNQWGDFRWPAFKGLIGAEARKLKYAEETAANPGWQDPNLDDAKWGVVTCSFGPKFWMLGPMSETADVSALETQLAGLKQVDPSAPVELAGRKYYWQPYEFSWRFGMEKDTAHQGYHGLKEEVADEFIGLGAIRKLVGWEIGNPGWPREKEEGGTRYYLWTAVMAPESAQARVLSGGLKPAAVWLNNVKTAKLPESARLQAGANPVLLRYDSIGRGYFVFRMSRADGPPGVDVGEVFSPAAYWIWHPDDAGGEAERFFRRTVVLKDAPRHAFIRITCCNSYQLYVNGQEVGTGNKWETVQQYDVAGKLVAGRNVIAVKAQAKSNIKGLIAELTIGDQYVATDSNWLSAKTAEKGWNESAFDDSAWTKARQLSNFPDSLWAKHRMGPPKLDRVVSATSDQGGQPKFEVSNLAMRWYNQDEILKFDTRPGERRPVGWYRFVSPPGLKAMTIAARGSIQAWVDGKELEARVQEAEKPGDLTENAVMYKVEIDKPSVGTVQVALRVEQARGCYGGATLPEPISLVCGAGQIALGDWSRIDGLASYSGGAWYRKTIALTNEQAAGRVMIDLGSVAGSVEVHVNGKLAGVRIAPPWKLDVSGLVRNGDNRFEVLVYNTLANHYSTIPTNYRGSPTSGLLGPVKLEFSGSIGEGQKNMKNP